MSRVVSAPAAAVRVLVVAPDVEDTLITRRLLDAGRAARYEVEWREGRDAALDALAAAAYDVVIVDEHGERGLDVSIARDAGASCPPLVLLTSQAHADGPLPPGAADQLSRAELTAAALERSIRYAVTTARLRRESDERERCEREAREELRAVRSRAEAVLDRITEGFLAVDAEWRITYVNPATLALTGLPREALVGRALWESFPGIVGTRVEQEYRRALADQRPVHFECHYAPLSLWAVLHVYPSASGLAIYVQDVTARKLAEEQQAALAARLEAERALLREVVQQLPVGVVIAELPSERLVLGNAELERLWRQPFRDLEGPASYSYWPAFHPDGRPYDASDRPLARTILTGRPVIGEEMRIRRADGTPGRVRVNSALVRDAAGEPMAAVVTVEDVTEQREMEETLRRREEQLAQIVAIQQEIATAPFDAREIMNLIAQRARAITGADFVGVEIVEGDATVYRGGSGASEPYARLRLPLDTSLSGACVRTGEVIRCDDALADPRVNASAAVEFNVRSLLCIPLLHQRRAIGVLKFGASAPRHFVDADVDSLLVLGGLAATAITNAADYAAKQQLIAERTAALETLRAREAYFRSLTENANDAVVIIDGAGAITYASPALTRVLGYSPEQVLGTRITEFAHPEDAARAGEALSRVHEGRPQPVLTEVRARHADGTWRTIRASGTNLLGDPAVSGVVVNIHDATNEKLLALQLRHAQKLEAVGQLAGGVAHDFNNLLTVIQLHGEFLAAELDGRDPRREDVEEIRRATDRASSLTRQLLAFSRQQILKPTTLDVNQVVAGILPMLRRLISEDIEIVNVAGTGPLTVVADKGQLEQVLMNLAINARDAMPNGGAISIETTVAELDEGYEESQEPVIAGNYVALTVSDTGVGMDRRTRERVFEPFFTTKDPGKGTGLGLSTVYGIVKQSNGYISVQSEPGLGTTFRIFLPLADECATQPADRPATTVPEGTETVLLVEDEEAVRSLARRILGRQGYRIIDAKHGVDALDVAAAHDWRFDIVVTDVVMPHMSGRELVERLRAIRPGLPALYITGYTSDDLLRRHSVDPQGARILQKPFTAAALAEAVRAALDAAPRQA
ncbi:MAG TPA: PAS domain S-box protein [Gemmatimonadaceae bacterium]